MKNLQLGGVLILILWGWQGGMLLCLFFGSHPKKSSEQDVRCFHCGWWFLYHAYTLGKILAGSRAIVCSSKALHWNH